MGLLSTNPPPILYLLNFGVNVISNLLMYFLGLVFFFTPLFAEDMSLEPPTGTSIMTRVHTQSHIHLTQKSSVSMILFDEKKTTTTSIF